MTRLLLAAVALVTAFTVAAGSRSAPAKGAQVPALLDPPALCKSGTDGGSRPVHGLLMVADRVDRDPELPCMQGG